MCGLGDPIENWHAPPLAETLKPLAAAAASARHRTASLLLSVLADMPEEIAMGYADELRSVADSAHPDTEEPAILRAAADALEIVAAEYQRAEGHG